MGLVMESDLDVGGALDDVVVGDDVAVLREDHAAAGAALHPLAEVAAAHHLLGGDLHHRISHHAHYIGDAQIPFVAGAGGGALHRLVQHGAVAAGLVACGQPVTQIAAAGAHTRADDQRQCAGRNAPAPMLFGLAGVMGVLPHGALAARGGVLALRRAVFIQEGVVIFPIVFHIDSSFLW